MKRLLTVLPLALLLFLSGCVNGQVVLPEKQAPQIGIKATNNMIIVGTANTEPVIILEDYSCPYCAQWENDYGQGLISAVMNGRLTIALTPVNVKNPTRSAILSARLYEVALKGNPEMYLNARHGVYSLMGMKDHGQAEIDGVDAPSDAALKWSFSASKTNVEAAIKSSGKVTTPSFSRDITDEVM